MTGEVDDDDDVDDDWVDGADELLVGRGDGCAGYGGMTGERGRGVEREGEVRERIGDKGESLT